METMDVRTMVLSKIAEHAALQPGNPEFGTDQRLADLELDSLAILEVLYDLEDYYSITVDAGELRSLATIGDLISVVNSSMANAA